MQNYLREENKQQLATDQTMSWNNGIHSQTIIKVFFSWAYQEKEAPEPDRYSVNFLLQKLHKLFLYPSLVDIKGFNNLVNLVMPPMYDILSWK